MLKESPSPARFLRIVKDRLGSKQLRSNGNMSRPVRRVALCGGSGSDLLAEAIRQKADAFVTADVKYHVFHEAESRILLVDAGHFETEVPVVSVLADRIKRFVRERGEFVPVTVSKKQSNPIKYVH
jgi:putative NIF3 family GTP cyclohydrolase 1 type 2